MRDMTKTQERRYILSTHAIARLRARVRDDEIRQMDAQRRADWFGALLSAAPPEKIFKIRDQGRSSILIEIRHRETHLFALIRGQTVITVLTLDPVAACFASGRYVAERVPDLSKATKLTTIGEVAQGRTMASQQTVENWFRDFFRARPDASIDAACKAAVNGRVRLGSYSTRVVADIRRQVREEMKTPAPAITPKIAPKPPPPVPRIPKPEDLRQPIPEPVPAPEPAPEPAPVSVPPAAPVTGGRAEMIARSAQKKKRVDELVLDNPNISFYDVFERVRSEFGSAVDTNYIRDAIRLAREAAGLEVRRRGRPAAEKSAPEPKPAEPVPAPVAAPPPAPKPPEPTPTPPPAKPTGVGERRLLTWVNEHGQMVMNAVAREDVAAEMTRLIVDGIKPDEITVWRPAKVAVRVAYSEDE